MASCGSGASHGFSASYGRLSAASGRSSRLHAVQQFKIVRSCTPVRCPHETREHPWLAASAAADGLSAPARLSATARLSTVVCQSTAVGLWVAVRQSTAVCANGCAPIYNRVSVDRCPAIDGYPSVRGNCPSSVQLQGEACPQLCLNRGSALPGLWLGRACMEAQECLGHGSAVPRSWLGCAGQRPLRPGRARSGLAGLTRARQGELEPSRA